MEFSSIAAERKLFVELSKEEVLFEEDSTIMILRHQKVTGEDKFEVKMVWQEKLPAGFKLTRSYSILGFKYQNSNEFAVKLVDVEIQQGQKREFLKLAVGFEGEKTVFYQTALTQTFANTESMKELLKQAIQKLNESRPNQVKVKDLKPEKGWSSWMRDSNTDRKVLKNRSFLDLQIGVIEEKLELPKAMLKRCYFTNIAKQQHQYHLVCLFDIEDTTDQIICYFKWDNQGCSVHNRKLFLMPFRKPVSCEFISPCITQSEDVTICYTAISHQEDSIFVIDLDFKKLSEEPEAAENEVECIEFDNVASKLSKRFRLRNELISSESIIPLNLHSENGNLIYELIYPSNQGLSLIRIECSDSQDIEASYWMIHSPVQPGANNSFLDDSIASRIQSVYKQTSPLEIDQSKSDLLKDSLGMETNRERSTSRRGAAASRFVRKWDDSEEEGEPKNDQPSWNRSAMRGTGRGGRPSMQNDDNGSRRGYDSGRRNEPPNEPRNPTRRDGPSDDFNRTSQMSQRPPATAPKESSRQDPSKQQQDDDWGSSLKVEKVALNRKEPAPDIEKKQPTEAETPSRPKVFAEAAPKDSNWNSMSDPFKEKPSADPQPDFQRSRASNNTRERSDWGELEVERSKSRPKQAEAPHFQADREERFPRRGIGQRQSRSRSHTDQDRGGGGFFDSYHFNTGGGRSKQDEEFEQFSRGAFDRPDTRGSFRGRGDRGGRGRDGGRGYRSDRGYGGRGRGGFDGDGFGRDRESARGGFDGYRGGRSGYRANDDHYRGSFGRGDRGRGFQGGRFKGDFTKDPNEREYKEWRENYRNDQAPGDSNEAPRRGFDNQRDRSRGYFRGRGHRIGGGGDFDDRDGRSRSRNNFGRGGNYPSRGRTGGFGREDSEEIRDERQTRPVPQDRMMGRSRTPTRYNNFAHHRDDDRGGNFRARDHTPNFSRSSNQTVQIYGAHKVRQEEQKYGYNDNDRHSEYPTFSNNNNLREPKKPWKGDDVKDWWPDADSKPKPEFGQPPRFNKREDSKEQMQETRPTNARDGEKIDPRKNTPFEASDKLGPRNLDMKEDKKVPGKFTSNSDEEDLFADKSPHPNSKPPTGAEVDPNKRKTKTTDFDLDIDWDNNAKPKSSRAAGALLGNDEPLRATGEKGWKKEIDPFDNYEAKPPEQNSSQYRTPFDASPDLDPTSRDQQRPGSKPLPQMRRNSREEARSELEMTFGHDDETDTKKRANRFEDEDDRSKSPVPVRSGGFGKFKNK